MKATETKPRTRRIKKKLSKNERAAARTQASSSPKTKKSGSRKSLAKIQVNTKSTEKLGCLDAAIHILKQSDKPLTCGQIMEQILEQKLWFTVGRTPAATLYSAIIREIQRKGDNARFIRADRGKFSLSSKHVKAARNRSLKASN